MGLRPLSVFTLSQKCGFGASFFLVISPESQEIAEAKVRRVSYMTLETGELSPSTLFSSP